MLGRAFNIYGESLVLVKFGAHYRATYDPLQPTLPPVYSMPEISGLRPVIWIYGGSAVSGTLEVDDPSYGLFELGLAQTTITVSPRIHHRDITPVDFGDIPAEVMTKIGDVNVSMDLIHYNTRVLDLCVSESMGGLNGGEQGQFKTLFAGKTQTVGTLLGHGLPPSQSGNRFMSLNILPRGNDGSLAPELRVYRFPTSYLPSQQSVLEIPIGTAASTVKMNWRAIPYAWPAYSGAYQTNPGNFSLSIYNNGQDKMIVPRVSGILPDDSVISSGLPLWDRVFDT